jgi:hypothetical protein
MDSSSSWAPSSTILWETGRILGSEVGNHCKVLGDLWWLGISWAMTRAIRIGQEHHRPALERYALCSWLELVCKSDNSFSKAKDLQQVPQVPLQVGKSAVQPAAHSMYLACVFCPHIAYRW